MRLDLLARAFDEVHGDVGLVAVGQLEGRVLDFGHFALGEEPQSVDQSQIRHEPHLKEQGGGWEEQNAALPI